MKPKAKAKSPRSKPKDIDQSKGREVVYQTPESTFYDSTGPNGLADCIDHTRARSWLGWETEADFVARMRREHPRTKNPVPSLKADGKDVPVGWTLKDHEGNNVVCWNNLLNRRFRESLAQEYAQDILNRKWAGPLTFPGQTVNGEPLIIGRTGLLISAQHRLIGLVLAQQMWAGKPVPKAEDGNGDNGEPRIRKASDGSAHWKDLWPEDQYPSGPVLESLVVTGVSESHLITRTVDNVEPRSLGDVISMSPLFRDLGPEPKRKASGMLANAVAFLWRRTKPRTAHDGLHPDPHTRFRTHSASEDFIDRHPRLVEAVRFILGLEEADDTPRVISATLKLSAGECAGMLYLMGSVESDSDYYRNFDPEPAEKALTWGKDDVYWQRACRFWQHVAEDTVPGDPKCVRLALESLNNYLVPGVSGTACEKYAVVSRAWNAFKEEGKVFMSDLFMPPEKGTKVRLLKGYEPSPEVEGAYKLVSDARSDFGGIDLGDQAPGEKGEVVEPTAEQVAEFKKRVKDVRRRGVKGPEGTAEKESRKDTLKGGGKGTRTVPRAPGEVATPPKVETDDEGKPPAPKLRARPKGKRGVDDDTPTEALSKAGPDYGTTAEDLEDAQLPFEPETPEPGEIDPPADDNSADGPF